MSTAVLRKSGLKPLEAKLDHFYYVEVGVVGIFYQIHVSFARGVTFNDGVRERYTVADTWKNGQIGHAPIGSDPSKTLDFILDEVSRLTEVFANEFLKANRK